MRRMLAVSALLVSILVAPGMDGGASAQEPEREARLEGRVVAAASDAPIAGATVSVIELGRETATDEDGAFVLQVPAGTYSVRIVAPGFPPREETVTLGTDEPRRLEVALQGRPIEVAGVTLLVDRFRLIGPHGIETIPGSVHYLDAEELESQNLLFEDAHRVLRQVPGVNVQEEEGYGLRVNLGLRGTGSERSSKITVMEDGVLAAPAPYAAPAAYYFPVVGRMDAIEVRKGSSQIKYGPHTTGGAINLISAAIPEDFTAGGEAAGGEFSTARLHARAGDSYDNVGWLLETYQLGTDGFKALDGGGDTGFEVSDYLLKLRLNTSTGASVPQEVELKLGVTDEISDETYLGLTEQDFRQDPFRRYAASQRDVMDADHTQVQLRHAIRPAERLDVTTVLYRNDFSRAWYKLQDVNRQGLEDVLSEPEDFPAELAILRGGTSEPGALRVRDNNREYYAQGIQSVLGLRLGGEGLAQELEIGARYHRDQEDRFQRDDAFQMLDGRMVLTERGAPGSQDNRVGDARAWALFAQDRISLGSWTFTPGLRLEDIAFTRTDYAKDDPDRSAGPVSERENGVTALIPGLGWTYAFDPGLSVFGGVHKGFGPPGPGADQDTEAEESVNYELGTRLARGALETQLVGFYNDYENILGAATLATGETGSGDLFNGGEVDARGLELALDYDLGAMGGWRPGGVRLPLRLAYTYTDAEFGTSFESEFEPWGTVRAGDELPYVPEHQVYAALGLERDRWGLNLTANYVGEMRTRAGSGPIPDGEGTDDYVVLGLSGEYAVTPWSRIVAGVQNLTDEEYVVARRPAGARPGLPRTLMAGIRVTP